MALTSSIVRDINQGADRLVTENHIDNNGKIYVQTYSALLNADISVLLNTHKTQLEEQLAEAEAEEIING